MMNRRHLTGGFVCRLGAVTGVAEAVQHVLEVLAGFADRYQVGLDDPVQVYLEGGGGQ